MRHRRSYRARTTARIAACRASADGRDPHGWCDRRRAAARSGRGSLGPRVRAQGRRGRQPRRADRGRRAESLRRVLVARGRRGQRRAGELRRGQCLPRRCVCPSASARATGIVARVGSVGGARLGGSTVRRTASTLGSPRYASDLATRGARVVRRCSLSNGRGARAGSLRSRRAGQEWAA